MTTADSWLTAIFDELIRGRSQSVGEILFLRFSIRDRIFAQHSGLSNGGLAAAFIAWRNSDLFGNVLSQSGAFWQGATSSGFTIPEETEFEWLTKQYAASHKLPLRIYLEAGLFQNACVNQGPSLLTANRHLRDILEVKGYTFRYKELSGCNHVPLCWRGTLADGLMFLLGSGE
jgi:enterochelin esterase-like enzyme